MTIFRSGCATPSPGDKGLALRAAIEVNLTGLGSRIFQVPNDKNTVLHIGNGQQVPHAGYSVEQ